MTTQRIYDRAPITEAVIEIRIDSSIDLALINKLSAKFKANYPQDQLVKNFDVAVELPSGENVSPQTRFAENAGHKLSSIDFTQLLLLWPSTFTISQLAPYSGWDQFFGRFQRDWAIWKREVGFKTVSRIGVRYINRIDIPMKGSTLDHELFLNVYPRLPTSLDPVSAYAVQAVIPLQDIGCKLTLNSAIVPSPVLNHASFVIDQDISKESDVPQNDEAIFQLLSNFRLKKNSVFEDCITDRARELFQP